MHQVLIEEGLREDQRRRGGRGNQSEEEEQEVEAALM
jgi:hypothetical protein